ncbi:hypothetical protein [Rodentibacter genomosp. 2]|uniref:Uncharacterized protein n=1 Tax=Rodentibacter genomosp. 2 TaxID=1908266 RepID=A0A1V3JF92_9PAST|nr:hypothetical protein [Rodentibacter genomosp. 2]OOF54895.1 hypothetical protein BKK55_08270 [Rodentibacter genomosp. 2]OOF55471.1 hypothetical protein BKK56_06075 [Rodentibacter genomosp. 2]
MKNIILGLMAFGLVACSAGGVDEGSLKPVNRALNVKHVCVKGSTRGAPDQFVANLKTSLKKKNITSESIASASDAKCDYILAFGVKGNRNIVAKAKLRLMEVKNQSEVGFVLYARKGDEKDRVAEVGLQGQTDTMIGQLFKDY